MILGQMITSETIVFLDENSQESVLRKLAKSLYQNGYVGDGYEEAILLREATFPTGLQTESIGVAIPHTDSIHVNKEAIGIGILDSPVGFKEMGSVDNTVKVRIIFMLAIKDPEAQLEVLQSVIELIQDHQKLEQIVLSQAKEDIMTIVQGGS